MSAGSLLGSTIVIVEDNADMRGFLRKALQVQGHIVQTFSNGQAALEGLKTVEEPKLILVDLAMPRMGGEEFIVQYRTHFKDSKAKILICSSNDEIQQIAQKLSVEGFLQKPLDLKNLKAQVQRLMD